MIWFLAATIRSAWAELRAYDLKLQPVWLAASAVLYLAGLLPCAWVWNRALAAMGNAPPARHLLRAYFIGHLGKYVPGKALVVVLRAGLLRDAGTNVKTAAVTVLYETLTMMAVGAALAAGIIAAAARVHWWLALVAIGLGVVALLPTLPPVFRYLAARLKLNADDPTQPRRLERFQFGWTACNWLAISAGWILIGGSLWAVLCSLNLSPSNETGGEAIRTLALCTAAASLATVAGFLSLLPGGILVREAILVLLLGELGFARADALIAAVLLRLVWLAAEVAVSALLYVTAGGRR